MPGARHLCKAIIARDIEKAVADTNAKIVFLRRRYRSALAAQAGLLQHPVDEWWLAGVHEGRLSDSAMTKRDAPVARRASEIQCVRRKSMTALRAKRRTGGPL